MQNILFLLDNQGFEPGAKFIILFLSILAVAAVLTLKGFSLWYASKHNERGWFIAILILNTLGVLELIYLFFFERDKKLKNFLSSKLKKLRRNNSE